MIDASAPAPGLLADRRFRRFWTGQTVSVFGDQITLLALPLAAVVTLGAGATEMGLLTAAGYAPHLLLSLVAGAWIDRRARRRALMVAADLGRTLVLLSIPVAYALDALTIGHLYAAAFLVGALTVVFDQSSTSLLVLLVTRERMVDAYGRLSTSQAAAQVGGPNLAGLLVSALTAPLALVVDAASFLVSAVSLLAVRVAEPAPQRSAGERVGRRIVEGARFVLGQPMLRASLGCTSTMNFFNLMLNAILVLYMSRAVGLPPAAIGLVLGVGAAGGLLGAVLAPRVARAIGFGRTILAGAALFTVPALLVPLAPRGAVTPAVVVLTAAELLSTLGVMLFDINNNSLTALLVPYRLRARASGTIRFFAYGIRPLGALAGGALGSALGLRPTLWVAAVGGLLSVLWLWRSPIPRLAEPPGPAG
jgi:MFS family permease